MIGVVIVPSLLLLLSHDLVGKLVVAHIGCSTVSLAMTPGAVATLLLGAVLHFELAGYREAWWVVSGLTVFMIFNLSGIQVIVWLTGTEISDSHPRPSDRPARCNAVGVQSAADRHRAEADPLVISWPSHVDLWPR